MGREKQRERERKRETERERERERERGIRGGIYRRYLSPEKKGVCSP